MVATAGPLDHPVPAGVRPGREMVRVGLALTVLIPCPTWATTLVPAYVLPPSMAGRNVVIPHYRRVSAFDPRTGRRVWQYTGMAGNWERYIGPAVAVGSRVYVPSSTGQVHVLTTSTGQREALRVLPASPRYLSMSAAGRLLVCANQTVVRAVDPGSLQLVWTFADREADAIAELGADDDNVSVVFRYEGVGPRWGYVAGPASRYRRVILRGTDGRVLRDTRRGVGALPEEQRQGARFPNAYGSLLRLLGGVQPQDEVATPLVVYANVLIKGTRPGPVTTGTILAVDRQSCKLLRTITEAELLYLGCAQDPTPKMPYLFITTHTHLRAIHLDTWKELWKVDLRPAEEQRAQRNGTAKGAHRGSGPRSKSRRTRP